MYGPIISFFSLVNFVIWSHLQFLIFDYRPQQKLRKGYVFTPVCQSFCSHGGVHPLGRHLPQADTPLGRHPLGRHPPWQIPLGRHSPWQILLGRHPPTLGRHPPQADTPWADTPAPIGRRPP